MIDNDFKLYFTKISIENIFAQRDEANRIYKEKLNAITADKEIATRNYRNLVNILSDVSYELFGKISMKSTPCVNIIGEYIWVCWSGFLTDTIVKYHFSVLDKTCGELKEIVKDKSNELIQYQCV